MSCCTLVSVDSSKAGIVKVQVRVVHRAIISWASKCLSLKDTKPSWTSSKHKFNQMQSKVTLTASTKKIFLKK